MNVAQFTDANAFYSRVEPFLAAREAEHNLTFGILSTIITAPEHYVDPYFALVEDDGAIQLVAIRTPPRPMILSLAASPDAVTLLARALHEQGIDLPGVNAPADVSRRFAETWASLSGREARVNIALRTFKLEQVKHPEGVSGFLRPATTADRDLIVRFEMGFRREAFADDQPDLAEVERAVDFRLSSKTGGAYLWDDGGAVSYTGYGGPTPNGIRIGPVYTPPELRGRGYASACVAAVSQKLLDGGRKFCFLFTDLANPTSNHIYQEIGYRPICDFTEYGF